MKKYALVSVSDKTNIVKFTRELNNLDYQIIATGNSYKLLKENSVDVIEVRDFTQFPEVFSGRVKTLHPKIFGGILMRRDNNSDKLEAEQNSVVPIDIICVNLYPFPKVVNRDDISLAEKIENIDIGGPSLIRASAKNYQFVSVLTDPSQYNDFLAELKQGEISLATKQKLAYDAFSYTSFYDTLIANYLETEFNQPKTNFRLNLKANFDLRYGENPHQKAYLFGDFENYFDILHGKELSYNNIVDLVAAIELVNDFSEVSCAIIKHTNPCGSSKRVTQSLILMSALFHAIRVRHMEELLLLTGKLMKQQLSKLNEIFLEIVVAPSFSPEALELLQTKKNRRIVRLKKNSPVSDFQIKSVPGGVLIQEKDNSNISGIDFKLATARKYSEKELDDFKICLGNLQAYKIQCNSIC